STGGRVGGTVELRRKFRSGRYGTVVAPLWPPCCLPWCEHSPAAHWDRSPPVRCATPRLEAADRPPCAAQMKAETRVRRDRPDDRGDTFPFAGPHPTPVEHRQQHRRFPSLARYCRELLRVGCACRGEVPPENIYWPSQR